MKSCLIFFIFNLVISIQAMEVSLQQHMSKKFELNSEHMCKLFPQQNSYGQRVDPFKDFRPLIATYVIEYRIL